MAVFGEVSRNPIHDDSNTCLVELVDHIAEIIRRAETAGRREHTDNLISPGAVKRVFCQRQKFDMSKAHIDNIGNQPVGHFAIGQKFGTVFTFPAPGTEVDFINGHRLVKSIIFFTIVHPVLIFPVIVVQIINYRCGFGADFAPEGQRVRFDQNVIFLSFDFIFINFAFINSGNKNIPHAAGRMLAHHINAAVPVIEISDNGNTFGIRRPNGKTDTAHAVHFLHMRAEFFIHVKVIAFSEKVDVNIA